jgi:hypothetical protein
MSVSAWVQTNHLRKEDDSRRSLPVAGLFLIVVCVLIDGCAGPTSPSNDLLTGRWSGTDNPPSQANAFFISLTIEQSGSDLSGTWNKTSTGGTLTGHVDGREVTMTLTTTKVSSPCPSFRIEAQVTGNEMFGLTHGVECPGSGQIQLRR